MSFGNFHDYGECFCGNRLGVPHNPNCRGCLHAESQGWPVPGVDAGRYRLVIPAGLPYAGKSRWARLSHYEQQGNAGWRAVLVYGPFMRRAPPGGFVLFADPRLLKEDL